MEFYLAMKNNKITLPCNKIDATGDHSIKPN